MMSAYGSSRISGRGGLCHGARAESESTPLGEKLDFGPAVASADGLPPGGQTNPVVVRLRLSHPDFAPSMRWKATGQVSGGPGTSE
jgi:hypothetical protein